LAQGYPHPRTPALVLQPWRPPVMTCSARSCFLLLLLGFALAENPNAENCDALGAEASKLREQLKSAQDEVSQLRAQLADAQGTEAKCVNTLSVTEAVTKTGSIAGGLVRHLLAQTDYDDIVVDKVSGHASAGWAFTVDVAGKIAEIDYSKHAESLKQHPIYVQHVAPAVGKASEMVQPHVDKYVAPAMAKARDYAGPALDVAKGASATASAHMNENVMPTLRHVSGRATSELPKHWETAQGGLAKSLDPIFHLAGKASPEHAEALPSHLWDRALMIVIVLFVAYHFSKHAMFFLRLFLRLILWTVKLALKIVLRWVLWKVVSYFVWLATGFYCCGLCRSRKRKEPEATNGNKKNGESNGATKGKESNNKPAQKATAEELAQLLETSKKKDKLDPAVKLLVGMAGTGKPMTGKNFPETVQGKLLEKDVLKKALGKFKEVDVKKLKL